MFFPTANWYMSVLTSSAHAPSSTDIEPNNFARVLTQMRTPGSGPNVAVLQLIVDRGNTRVVLTVA